MCMSVTSRPSVQCVTKCLRTRTRSRNIWDICTRCTKGRRWLIWCLETLFLLEKINKNLKLTRQVSSMIHSARPTVSQVVNIVFVWNLFCFARFWKAVTDGQLWKQWRLPVWKQWRLPAVTVGRPSGSITLPCFLNLVFYFWDFGSFLFFLVCPSFMVVCMKLFVHLESSVEIETKILQIL